MATKSRVGPSTGTVILDGLLNYFLFAPLTLIFWYGAGIIFEEMVIDGKTDPRFRAAVVMVASAGFEVGAALAQDHLAQLGDVLQNTEYFIVTRLYNFLMAMADLCLFLSTQTFYTEHVGPNAGPEVHARWAAAVLAVLLALRISKSLMTTPFVVSLDDGQDDEWFEFSLYFKTTASSPFVLRLYDAIFSVVGASLFMDTYWYTLTFTFDGLIYPSDYVKAMVVSCVAGYAIIGLVKCLTPLASDASKELERNGRTVEKLIVEDLYVFAALFGVILLGKGLNSFAEQLSVTLGPVFGVSARTMAVVDQLIAFVVMCSFGVSSLLVFKGPSIDGELTNGQGLNFPTEYFAVQPQTRRL